MKRSLPRDIDIEDIALHGFASIALYAMLPRFFDSINFDPEILAKRCYAIAQAMVDEGLRRAEKLDILLFENKKRTR